jgi:hypothetical protein
VSLIPQTSKRRVERGATARMKEMRKEKERT